MRVSNILFPSGVTQPEQQRSLANTNDLSGVIAGLWRVAGAPCLVVVSSLQKIDSFVTDAIHQTVFLCDSARPAAGKYIFERFGFPRTVERISHDCLNQIEDPDCSGALTFHPESQVLKELRLEYGDPPRLSIHRASLYAMRPWFGV
jgi:hypothetical protein